MDSVYAKAKLGKVKLERARSRAQEPSHSGESENNDSEPESLVDEEIDGIGEYEVGR